MRILFLQKRPLFPANTGGKIRTLNVLRHLAKWHDVTYLCSAQPDEDESLAQMRELGVRLETVPWSETPRESVRFYGEVLWNLTSRFPFNVNKDYDRRLRRRAGELIAEQPFDLLVCDFVQMARNAIGLDVGAKILFEHNVEAQIFERHARNGSSWLRQSFMHYQWRKMQRFEAEAGRQFDRVIAVSAQDRDKFVTDYAWSHVSVIDTAVDCAYFQPIVDCEQADRVVFIGSMDWLPNEQGVRNFVEEIWPRVLDTRPEATFHIGGRTPTPAVERLAEVNGVTVAGTVPDIRPHVAEAQVVVVPLNIGGGTRLKIFEAMAMEKPVVSTSLGAEGLEVVSGEHLEIADRPEDFADRVISLLDDEAHRKKLAMAARRLVLENYSAETVARQFEAICLETVERVAAARRAASTGSR